MVVARYLLDTNTCIYWLNTRSAHIVERLRAMPPGTAVMSAITWGELQFGAAKSRESARVRRNLGALAEAIALLAPSPAAGQRYGELRAALESKGMPIRANNLWIAAQALAERLTLVTNNLREFRCIPKLKIENWVG